MEVKEALKGLLNDTTERVIIAECIYKAEDFRSFSITVSDAKEDGIDFPYAPYADEEKGDDLLNLLKRRKSGEMDEAVHSLLEEIKEALLDYSVELSEEDIASFITLEKPTLLLQRSKK